jgi:NAD(P)-dependent dehydrogenase (short-subunit alcohol dehydrogenase family)
MFDEAGFTLKGSVTVVTGGGKGLGLGLARGAARRGSKVVIASISDASAAVTMIRTEGGDADWFQVDVSDPEAVRRLAQFTRDRFGSVNLLINNAAGGGNPGGSLLDPSDDDLRRVLEVNVLGYANTIRAFADDLQRSARNGWGHILNVGSEHSLGVPPHVVPISWYTVTKQAGLAITEVARRDFADTGVGASLLAPGYVLTEVVQHHIDSSPAMADAILPYVQTVDAVADAAFVGIAGGRDLIVTNPKSVPFARERAEKMLMDLYRADTPRPTQPHPHDNSGDITKCPVFHE